MLRPESLAPMLPDRRAPRLGVGVHARRLGRAAAARAGRRGRARRRRRAAARHRAARAERPAASFRCNSSPKCFPASCRTRDGMPRRSQLVVFSDAVAAAAIAPRQSARDARRRHPHAALASSPSSRRTTRVCPPVPVKHNRRTIIVDAGHGGVDNGMTGPIGGGPKIYEKNITLAVAKKLGEQLESRGVDVVYTRTTDTLIALDDRGRIANRAQGDLFISIHVNAANPNWKDPGGSRGFETYFLSEAQTEDARRVEQMENDVGPVRGAPGQDRQGRSAQLHSQRHAAERAPPRIERAGGDHSAAARRRCIPGRAAA